MTFDFGTQELRMLWASVVLGVVQLFIVTLFSVGARGMPWALGPRDVPGAPMGELGNRLERAYRNFLETFPLYAAVVLLASALDRHDSLTNWGAQLYFYGRVLYVPLYAFGIPAVRRLAYAIAMSGIVLVLLARWPGW